MTTIHAFVALLIFPGFLFLTVISLAAEYVDRKIYARLQNRIGPPWFQPLADIIKLCAKEEVIPTDASAVIFRIAPIFALASAVTAFLYIPLWGSPSLYTFNGDVVVVLYLLTLPTMAFFIGGWYSTSLFARIGSVRAITQLFAYEIPLFMGILSAAVLADTWSLWGMIVFYNQHPTLLLANVIGFGISVVALLGKLEKAPFDIPEAETEVVAGSFTEYSGRYLAFFRLTIDIELVTGAALLAAVFFPVGVGLPLVLRMVIFTVEVTAIVALIALLRTILARLRIDQMIQFCWKYMVPLGILQFLINLIVKGIIQS